MLSFQVPRGWVLQMSKSVVITSILKQVEGVGTRMKGAMLDTR